MSNEETQRNILDCLDGGKPVRFKDLVECLLKKGVSRAAMARQLNNLEKDGTIVKEAISTETGAGTQYYSKFPRFSIESMGVQENRHEGFERLAEELNELRRDLTTIQPSLAGDPSKWSPEALEIYRGVNYRIGDVVGNAVSAVSILFIDIIERYSKEPDPVLAKRYLDVAINSYIPMFLLEIAKLTPPGSNFGYPASGIARAMLIENPGFDEIAEEIIDKSIEPQEKKNE
jgi:predicted transcriptional regulator